MVTKPAYRRLPAAAALAAAMAMASCSPPARSTSYFEAHPEDAAKVAANCKAGEARGAECESAETAITKMKSVQTQADATRMSKRSDRVARKW